MPEARTADQAKRKESQIRDQYFEGSYGDPGASRTLVDFAEKVWLKWCKEHHPEKSYRNDRAYFQAIKSFFGKRTFNEISELLIEKFKRHRLETPVLYGNPKNPKERPRAAATVNRELAALSKIFSMAMKSPHKLVTSNPVRDVPKLIENNRRTRYLSPAEEIRLFDALLLNPALTAIVTMAIHTGMRQGEILQLRWEDIDFQAEMIHVRNVRDTKQKTKSGYDRSVPMNAKVRAELESLPNQTGVAWLFPGEGKTGHLVEIKKAWATALRIAKIAGFRFHDLRHTAGSRYVAAGAHLSTVKELLGHRNTSTTERYVHAMEEAKRAAVAAVENFGQPSNVIPLKRKAK